MSIFMVGYLYLLSAAFIYACMPVLIRFLDSGSVPPISQVFLRYIFAFAFAFIYFTRSNKLVSLKKIKKDFLPWLVFISIVGYGLTNVFFTKAILLTEVSVTLFSFYTFALITPVLGYLILKDKLKKEHVLALTVSAFGLFFIFQPSVVSGVGRVGIGFALLAALTQSLYLVGTRKLKGVDSSLILLSSTFWGMIAVGLIAVVSEQGFYFGDGLASLTGSTWAAIALFGFFNWLAWYLMSKGFQMVLGSIGSVILLSELLFATVFAFFIFGEIPSITTIFGGLLILGSSILVIFRG